MKNSNPYTNQFRTFAAIHKVAEKKYDDNCSCDIFKGT